MMQGERAKRILKLKKAKMLIGEIAQAEGLPFEDVLEVICLLGQENFQRNLQAAKKSKKEKRTAVYICHHEPKHGENEDQL